eukprot:Skav206973  [mRNA]  locus=scaffold1394:8792:10938:- [translate_table: standard]
MFMFVGSYEKLIGGSTPWAWQAAACSFTGKISPQVCKLQQIATVEASKRRELAQMSVLMSVLSECLSKDEQKAERAKAAAKKWRVDGMRSGRWRGPADTADDEQMFQAISCSIGEGDKAEERRPDGLLAKHAYSVLQADLWAFWS